MNMKLVMVYSHWVAADAIFSSRHAKTEGDEKVGERMEPGMAEAARSLSTFFRMLVFYALVYVVVEAYQELPDREPELDKLLASGPMNEVRRLRNAVFHVQDEPLNAKLWAFLETEGSEKWIKNVHRALEAFFIARLPIKTFLQAVQK